MCSGRKIHLFTCSPLLVNKWIFLPAVTCSVLNIESSRFTLPSTDLASPPCRHLTLKRGSGSDFKSIQPFEPKYFQVIEYSLPPPSEPLLIDLTVSQFVASVGFSRSYLIIIWTPDYLSCSYLILTLLNLPCDPSPEYMFN